MSCFFFFQLKAFAAFSLSFVHLVGGFGTIREEVHKPMESVHSLQTTKSYHVL